MAAAVRRRDSVQRAVKISRCRVLARGEQRPIGCSTHILEPNRPKPFRSSTFSIVAPLGLTPLRSPANFPLDLPREWRACAPRSPVTSMIDRLDIRDLLTQVPVSTLGTRGPVRRSRDDWPDSRKIPRGSLACRRPGQLPDNHPTAPPSPPVYASRSLSFS